MSLAPGLSPYIADDKDPGSTIGYSIDWADELGTDTIITSQWNVPAPLSLVSSTSTTTVASVVISGGAVGRTFIITNTITTAGGSKEPRSIQIYCRNL